MQAPLVISIFVLAVPSALAQSSADRPAYASEPVRASFEDEREMRKPVRCLGVTATRIRRPNDPCQSPGRRFDGDDIDGTGEVDLGQALRKLDPSISGGRR